MASKDAAKGAQCYRRDSPVTLCVVVGVVVGSGATGGAHRRVETAHRGGSVLAVCVTQAILIQLAK